MRNISPVRALLLILALAASAATAKPGLTWVSATEGYFTLPVSQRVHYTANGKTATADAWGLGLRLGYASPGFWGMK